MQQNNANYVFPDTLLYTQEHIWLRPSGKDFVLGITDYAQQQLGEIVFVDLPTIGSHFTAHEAFGTVESLKSVNSLFMPVTATVCAVNKILEENPMLVNIDAYERGWLIHIDQCISQQQELLTAKQYSDFVSALRC